MRITKLNQAACGFVQWGILIDSKSLISSQSICFANVKQLGLITNHSVMPFQVTAPLAMD